MNNCIWDVSLMQTVVNNYLLNSITVFNYSVYWVPFGKVEFIASKILRSPPWLVWSLWNICVTNDHGYVPLVVNTSRSFPHSLLITGFVTRLTRRMPLVEPELITLPEHLSSPPDISGVRVTRSLVVYACFVDRCLSFCTFSIDQCVVCSSSIYGFWLPPFGIFKLFLYSHQNNNIKNKTILYQ